MTKLLKKDMTQRLGFEDDHDLIQHPWFEDIDIAKLLENQINAPIIPEIEHETDVELFDNRFTEIDPSISEEIDEEMLNELGKYDPMWNGFYLDPEQTEPDQSDDYTWKDQ